MKVQKEGLVFDNIIITLESQEESDTLWDFIEDNYDRYDKDSFERNFLIKLSNAFCFMGG